MLNIIEQINKFKQRTFSKLDNKTQLPLLSHEEILDHSFKVKNKKNISQYKNEIAFKKIGDVRSIYRGHGMDYEESRRYQAGDDPRYMNWQLSARTGQHYIKVYREEKQPGVFVLVDRRQSMRFGTRQRLKVTQAVRAAAISAFSAQENNYSIGGVIVDKNIEWFKESTSKQAAFDFINRAARPALPIFADQKEDSLHNILLMLNEVLVAGSTLYLISDFQDLKEKSQAILLQLSSSHQIHAIQIVDPAETKLPSAGVISLKQSINSQQRQIDTYSVIQQENYQAAAKQYFYNKKSLFEDVAIPYQIILTTDDDINISAVF